MDKDSLDSALDRCDLGDACKALVRQYPHKDMLPALVKVREVLDPEPPLWSAPLYSHDECQAKFAQLEKMLAVAEEALKTLDGMLTKNWAGNFDLANKVLAKIADLRKGMET